MATNDDDDGRGVGGLGAAQPRRGPRLGAETDSATWTLWARTSTVLASVSRAGRIAARSRGVAIS
ncbi:MAG TPA: hypothetical protein VER37_04540, partial [Thermomicrobiales bacterium]|nr:hypothetical protein [Thermomicrobiales bacterium]